MLTFYLNSIYFHTLETVQLKCTYFLTIQSARSKALRCLKDMSWLQDQKNPISDDHCCSNFTEDMVIPPKWRENVLNCRKCKRNLVGFLSHHFLKKIKQKLQPQQRFVTAGGFSGVLSNQALFTEPNRTPQCDSRLACNAEESDMRIWLHVIHSAGQKKLVLSPDTDVYHIGLPIVSQTMLECV